MEYLSIELLERIVRKVDHISMCRLASMSAYVRKAVHSYCASHLRYLADQDSTTAASLAASGWVVGNDHDIWACQCIILVVGPWYWWFKGRKKEVVVDPDYNTNVGAGCTVINNKLFTSPIIYNYSSVVVRTRDRMSQVKVVMDSDSLLKLSRKKPIYLTNFENTLLVMFTEWKREAVESAIMVYDAKSLQNVCDIEFMKAITDEEKEDYQRISDIKMCKNKIGILVMFMETYVTQIWDVNTKNPNKDSIVFVQAISNYSSPLSIWTNKVLGFLALNSRYLVRICKAKTGNHSVDPLNIEYFDLRKKMKSKCFPILDSEESHEDHGKFGEWECLDHQGSFVRQTSMMPGCGSILCLVLDMDISHRNPHYFYQVIVQLFDLSTAKIVTRKYLGKSSHFSSVDKVKISWWSEHLTVLVRNNSISSSLYTWSPGQLEMWETRIKLPLGDIDCRFAYFHLDYQGIVTAKVNRNRMTAFQSYTYKIE